jgi:hypothetical protein
MGRLFVEQLSKRAAKADMALRERPRVADEREQHPARYMVPNLREKQSRLRLTASPQILNIKIS